jgi:hypothetical protein
VHRQVPPTLSTNDSELELQAMLALARLFNTPDYVLGKKELAQAAAAATKPKRQR